MPEGCCLSVPVSSALCLMFIAFLSRFEEWSLPIKNMLVQFVVLLASLLKLIYSAGLKTEADKCKQARGDRDN